MLSPLFLWLQGNEASPAFVGLYLFKGIIGIITSIGLYRLMPMFGSFIKYIASLTLIEGIMQLVGSVLIFYNISFGADALLGGIGYIFIWFSVPVTLFVLLMNAKLFFNASKLA